MLIQREWFNEHGSNYLRPEVYKHDDVCVQLKEKLGGANPKHAGICHLGMGKTGE